MFMRSLPVFVLAVFVFGWAMTPGAQAADPNLWTVTSATGKARVLVNGSTWRELRRGMILQPGSRVETGRKGSISLVRPGDSLKVSPNGRFEIPKSDKTGTVAHIKQTLGTLLFKITTRPENPFNVKTPYMTAVIKGTTFTVSINASRTALHVAEGAVEVTSALTGQVAMVHPGRTATMTNGAGGRLRLSGGNGRGSGKSASTTKLSGKSVRISHKLGIGRIDLVKVTKGLVNDGNKPAKHQNSGSGKKQQQGRNSFARMNPNSTFRPPSLLKIHNNNKGIKANGNGNGNANGNGKANGNANGNGNGNGNGNANGNGNGNANGNGNGNANGNANGNGKANGKGKGKGK
jgi:hypothetical protein